MTTRPSESVWLRACPLDEKKSKYGDRQAGAYPGQKGSSIGRVVGVVGDH
jgi:hypothetical protein